MSLRSIGAPPPLPLAGPSRRPMDAPPPLLVLATTASIRPYERERRERERERERETDGDRYKVAGSESEAHRSTTTTTACGTRVAGPSKHRRHHRFSPPPPLSDQIRKREGWILGRARFISRNPHFSPPPPLSDQMRKRERLSEREGWRESVWVTGLGV